ncbi:hypothetical protein GGE50_000446 [Rhizobium leguminosarum]|nr:hypothetical protein RLV_5667 [Rhizobium leguminosarum bv. viciae]MBB4326592.1 hypothetical protein [Rhizobium leguminosarum]MBB4339063.1 hypothetical protein [Rhizobium leguminosarum]MBB4352118.1 hypothetical protein [Rhizobium leguminosarum]MBB4465319.1 hypothetical protein [Rhizobium leguminosarum]
MRQCGFRSRRRIHRGARLQLLALPPAGRTSRLRAAREAGAKTPEDSVSTYTFNRHVIWHHFCANCGIAPFGEGVAPDGAAMASINLRCIPAVDLGALTVKAYDGAAH